MDGQTIVDPVVVDNTIRVIAGATAEAAVRITGGAGSATAVEGGRIAGNRVSAEGRLGHGVLVDRSVLDLEVDDNRLAGFTSTGVAALTHRGASVRRNRIVGPGELSDAVGIRLEGGSRLTCTDNTVSAVATGVSAANQSIRTIVSRNVVEAASTGIDLRGTTGATTCRDNVFTGVGTASANMPGGADDAGCRSTPAVSRSSRCL